MEWQLLTLDMALRRTVSAMPIGDALVYKRQRLTWTELDQWSSRLAAAFLANGVQRGQTVATFMVNSFEWVAIFFALGKIGTAIVPVNFRYKGQELAYVLKQSGAAMLLATVRHDGRDQAPILTEALAEARTPFVVTLGGSPDLGSMRQKTWEAFEQAATEVGAADVQNASSQVGPNGRPLDPTVD